MTRQARTVYDKIGATLEAAGRSFADVGRVVEYVTREGFERYAKAEAVRNEVFGIRAPAVNTVPVARLLRSDAFIEIEVTAGDFVASSPGLPVARESAGVIYLPTFLPTDDRGEIVSPGDVVSQTEQIFKNAEKLLARLGTDLSHVVMTVDYLATAARKNYRASGHVRMSYLGPIYPGAAGIVQPRLLHPDALVQYDIIATRDQPTLIDPGWDRYRSLSYSAGVRAGKLVFMSGQVAMDPVSMTLRAILPLRLSTPTGISSKFWRRPAVGQRIS
jgi:enamine deaminase RidA (YjgF/YER057c/UK114 family)